MEKITALLVGCSLAIAGAVMAQQPEGQESPSKRGARQETTQQGTAPETKQKSSNAREPGAKSNATEPTTTQTGGKQRGKGQRGKSQTETNAESSPATETNAGQEETGKKGRHGRDATTNTANENAPMASPGVNQAEQGRKGRRNRGETATASASPAPSAAAATSPATSTTNAAANVTTNAATTNTAATNTAGAGNLKGEGTVGRGGKRVEKQQVQQIKQQHASFKAQPKPNVAPAMTFNQNHRISGAESWQGPQYEVFRSYHPEWHDQGWYHSHYAQVVLIAGGWYFLNQGYWYPAWGYDSNAAYYAYDGPIYVGQSARPPDQVIADVQSELQDMGYYQGEVDGLLGPLTRQALQDYQADHGLMVTEAIDEPTLDALQLGGAASA
jgi:hypothetical protein